MTTEQKNTNEINEEIQKGTAINKLVDNKFKRKKYLVT